MIVLADIAMSFDNVVAISSIAGDHLGLVLFGLLLSIPLVVWGSVLIARLMSRYRWIIWLGGAVLGHVAGAIIFQDHHVLGWLGIQVPAGLKEVPLSKLLEGTSDLVAYTVHSVPWILAGVLFIAGWLFSRRTPVVPKEEADAA
jgi:predicted tellurium resistance membrane protein TerC